MLRLCTTRMAPYPQLNRSSRSMLLLSPEICGAHGGVGYDVIRRARTYLQEHFNKPVSLDELSACAGLSPYHLIRSFTRHFGLPPHAYQNHIRVERARTLMIAGAPLAQVASSVGFADQSHFTRHFRRIMNVTPANYTRATR